MRRYDSTRSDQHSMYSNAYMTGATDLSMTDGAESTIRRVDDLSDSDDDKKSTSVKRVDSRSQSVADNADMMSMGSYASNTEVMRLDQSQNTTVARGRATMTSMDTTN